MCVRDFDWIKFIWIKFIQHVIIKIKEAQQQKYSKLHHALYIFWNCGDLNMDLPLLLLHLTRIFNLSTISSFQTRTLNYSTRVYWHQIGCKIASYGWECRICRGEHGRTGCMIKISSPRPRTASRSVELTNWIRSRSEHKCLTGMKISRTFYLRAILFSILLL